MRLPLPPLPPHDVLAAYVRDLVYEDHGREVRGTRYFAPGTLVYVDPPYSGDGWERTHITGPVRGSGRFLSVLGPRSRLVHHHRRRVSDPEVLEAFRWTCGGPWLPGREWTDTLLSHFPEDALADTRAAGWAPGEWERLTSRLLCPERPRLAECLATVLDVSREQARALHLDGIAGRALRNLQKGWSGPNGPTPLRSAHAAWTALAPAPWPGEPRRSFLTGEGEEAAVPDSPLAAVCLCSDVDGVLAAEGFARELAALCGAEGPVEVVWRAVSRSEVYQRAGPYSRVPRLTAPERLEELSELFIWGVRAIAGANVHWRARAEELLTRHGVPVAEALRLLFSLLGQGYALEHIEPRRVVLLCPLLPSP
jgi:hypothetical protein